MKFIEKNSNSYRKDLLFIFALSLGAFLILRMKSVDKDDFKPLKMETSAKAVSVSYVYDREAIEEGDEYVSDIYAGRTEETKNTQYNSLGLPTDRYWLSRNEWQGKHIKKMPLDNAKKRLLMNRFKEWKRGHMQSFIDEMLRAAVKERETFPKIPPSLIAAQAIIETNFGLSRLALEGNNYFGHKYRGKDTSKFLIAADDSPTDRFTKYKSTWYSLRHHTRNVLMRLYYPRIKGKADLDGWLEALCGATNTEESLKFVVGTGNPKKPRTWNGGYTYATSCFKGKCYSQKLAEIIKTYNLDLFD
jgi:uncharacterized FlgJ-related protein